MLTQVILRNRWSDLLKEKSPGLVVVDMFSVSLEDKDGNVLQKHT